ncbi:MAG: Panacea domain-containing protein, partial [Chthoniobacteraceae bacterium]
VSRLIEKSGGKADYLRIIKLIYLADRDSIIKRGVPIVGGKYYSMRKGPVIGEVMCFVNQMSAPGWREYITPRSGNTINLLKVPEYSSLSPAELEILDAVVAEHLEQSTDDLVKWCHQFCNEYEHVGFFKRKDIVVENILRAGGKTSETIHRVVKQSEELMELDEMLA